MERRLARAADNIGSVWVESVVLLVDEVFPEQPMRQWVLSFPFQLRFLFASRPQLLVGCWGSCTVPSRSS
jgi:hypothetical protein